MPKIETRVDRMADGWWASRASADGSRVSRRLCRSQAEAERFAGVRAERVGKGLARTVDTSVHARRKLAEAIRARRAVDTSLDARRSVRREILLGRGWSPEAIDADPGEIKWLPTGAPVNANYWELKTGS